jgi:hypothetical protein
MKSREIAPPVKKYGGIKKCKNSSSSTSQIKM